MFLSAGVAGEADDWAGTTAGQLVDAVTFTAAPAVNATAVAISAVEGTAATVEVAVFTDPGGAEATSDYTATIVWGDQKPMG